MQYEQAVNGDESNIVKGLVAGVIAGFVGTAVMNQFQKMLSNMLLGEERSHGAQSLQQGSPNHGAGRMLKERGKENPNDDSAERMASAISVGAFDHELTEDEKDTAGTLFHYGFSVSMGALYGATVELIPQATVGAGSAFGAAVWLGADEGVVPLLGLSKDSSEYPFPIHASAFASHIVYGLTTEGVRRIVRKAL